MSIFKKSFKPFVQGQIKIRQTKIGQGDRTHFLTRQCTIRMASGVNVNGSNTTAKNNVLEGGTKSNDKLRGGFATSYDAPKNGFGKIPMAGITSVGIKTKTAYGSLRQATVNFECHSTDQLSLLEKLYMRPGYPCLLEWGWAPYLKNDGTTESNILYLSSNPKFWNGEYNQDTLQKAVIANKKTYEGNYDGLYGIVKDFNYSIRPDGGYTCRTELISIGEVLESIKPRISQDDNTKSVLEKTLEDLSEYAVALSSEVGDESIDKFIREIIEEPNNKEPRLGLSTFDIERILKRYSIDEETGEIKGPWLGNFNEVVVPAIESTRKKQLEEFSKNYSSLKNNLVAQSENLETDPYPSVWIRWGDLTRIINNSFPKDNNKKNIIKVLDDGLEFNENKIEENLALKTSNIQTSFGGAPNITTFSRNLSLSVNPTICLFPENTRKMFMAGHPAVRSNSRKIKDICFEVSYLLKTFRSQYYIKDEFDEQVFNENFSIGKFIKKIWNDVNSSCGNGHNFNIINDFEKGHIIKVIDLNFKGENLKLSDLVSLNALSTNSIVRDFNYDLSVPSSLTATIAIAAQNPDDPESLEAVTFSAFNRGIRNRFIKYPISPVKDKTWSPAELSIYEKKFLRFVELRTALEMFLIRLNGPTYLNAIDEIDLNNAKAYNQQEDESGTDTKLKIKLVGDPYTDFNEIPGSDSSSAKAALRYLNTARVDLENLTLGNGDRKLIGLPKKNKLDISSIIPLKFNVKLDGISGIVIGNVFKMDPSRLPELYKQNKVAFIVAGEEQNIDGQDWTTTITGQATILPI